MIDLHTHCLPNVDDGAKTLKESMEMLSESAAQGVKICAATPHCSLHRASDLDDFLERRENGFRALSAELAKAENLDLKLLLGAEVYLDHDINQHDGIRKLCIGDTDYMLIELDVRKADPRYPDWLYSLTLKGIHPLIAHVDRYHYWESLMQDLEDMEIHYQINASRCLSLGGRKILHELLKKGYDYILSSDMHNMRSRKPMMGAAYERVAKKDRALADELFTENAKELLFD